MRSISDGPTRVRVLSKPGFEAPAVVAGFDDVTVMGQAIEQCGRHLGVREDARPRFMCQCCHSTGDGVLPRWRSVPPFRP